MAARGISTGVLLVTSVVATATATCAAWLLRRPRHRALYHVYRVPTPPLAATGTVHSVPPVDGASTAPTSTPQAHPDNGPQDTLPTAPGPGDDSDPTAAPQPGPSPQTAPDHTTATTCTQQIAVYLLPDDTTACADALRHLLPELLPGVNWEDGASTVVGDSCLAGAPESTGGVDEGGPHGAGQRVQHVVGLDAEWQPEMNPGQRHSVSVLQLAGPSWCVICRPNRLAGGPPVLLQRLLSSSEVAKAGVGIQEDCRRLRELWGVVVQGVVDARLVCQLVAPEVVQSVGASLSSLARGVLGRQVDKGQQCSDWGNTRLSKAQITYAAQDAWVSQELIRALMQRAGTQQADRVQSDNTGQFLLPFLGRNKVKHVQQALHSSFGPSNTTQYPFTLPGLQPGSLSRVCKATTFDQASASTDARQGRSGGRGEGVERDGSVVAKVGKRSRHALRRSVLYENCKIQAPDGGVLCTCSKKKIEWYLSRDLGVIVCEEPLTLRLHFEPKGRGHQDDSYYMADKRNQCVVCGYDGTQTTPPGPNSDAALATVQSTNTGSRSRDSVPATNGHVPSHKVAAQSHPGAEAAEAGSGTWIENGDARGGSAEGRWAATGGAGRAGGGGKTESYLRHSIVPHCYRKCFPVSYKSHLSHDIVLLCLPCHQVCSAHNQRRMQELGHQYQAPLEEDNRKYKHDHTLGKLRAAARALLNSKGELPAGRQAELRAQVAQHYQVPDDELTQELLEQAANVESKKPSTEWASHAERVVAALGGDIEGFVRGWRAHFLQVMRPRFLPPHWSVEARVANSSGMV